MLLTLKKQMNRGISSNKWWVRKKQADLDIIRVVEDFVRGRESEVLCKLTASSAAFYALPRQLLRCSAGETARGRRRRWQLLLWLGFLCVKLRDWGPSRGGDNRRRHWCRR